MRGIPTTTSGRRRMEGRICKGARVSEGGEENGREVPGAEVFQGICFVCTWENKS